MISASLRWLSVASALWLLAGCAALEDAPPPASEPVQAPATAPPPPPAPKPEAKPAPSQPAADASATRQGSATLVYTIDPAASVLAIRVYRAGKLGDALGHNHIVSSTDLSGSVTVPGAITEAEFRVELPVAELVVDDPELRKAAGEGFEKEPSHTDIAGTRANMLGERGLEADRYPRIEVTGRVVGGVEPKLDVEARIRLHGRSQRLRLPVEVTRADGVLTAVGRFKVLQSDFGITPLSLVGGALRVQDELTVQFEFVARR